MPYLHQPSTKQTLLLCGSGWAAWKILPCKAWNNNVCFIGNRPVEINGIKYNRKRQDCIASLLRNSCTLAEKTQKKTGHLKY
jgi:hypothetical protein